MVALPSHQVLANQQQDQARCENTIKTLTVGKAQDEAHAAAETSTVKQLEAAAAALTKEGQAAEQAYAVAQSAHVVKVNALKREANQADALLEILLSLKSQLSQYVLLGRVLGVVRCHLRVNCL